MIAPLSALSSIVTAPASAATSAASADPLISGSELEGSGSADFSNVVTNAIDALQNTQATASADEAQAAAGQGNLADTMIAATQASLDTEVTTSLLSQATNAYNSIMNMSF